MAMAHLRQPPAEDEQRHGKGEADQVIPFSNYDSSDPEELWAWMQAYEEKTGGRLLAIPHNGNLSNGLMFDDVTFTGKKLDRDYAERRMRWEPVYEVTQMKGDGEAHPSLSPNDEFADYGTWDKGSFGPEPKTQDMLPREYAREALKRGMKYEETLGANPFKFGMVGVGPPNHLKALDKQRPRLQRHFLARPGLGIGPLAVDPLNPAVGLVMGEPAAAVDNAGAHQFSDQVDHPRSADSPGGGVPHGGGGGFQ